MFLFTLQETERYKGIVRQHVDLAAIQAKLDDGSYSSFPRAFYRDLLLLFTNAIVFFPKPSEQALAASQLRAVVLSEVRKLLPSPPELQPKPEPERSDSLLAKHKSSAPIVVCRKRSSISAKASNFGVKAGESKSDEKATVDLKSSAREEQSLGKAAGPKEKSTTTGVRSLRRGGKNRSGSLNKNQATSTSHGGPETLKADKKKAEALPTSASASAKKRGAADFLKRIKKNSPMDMGKSPLNDTRSGRGGGGDDKRKRSDKGDGRKDRLLRQSGVGKQGKDESSPSKRSVGRPPKKAAVSDAGKKGRESGGGDKEAASSSSKRSRKQARR